MKKGYQGDELWTAVNPLTGKREIVDLEGEFIPGETIVKLYYCKQSGRLCDDSWDLTVRSSHSKL
jgi:hypothetical protein